jgi:N-acylneuraminate cytidylyltransferase
MEVLAIIPARGGSKKIPRKNIRDLAGKPMLAWSCEAARASRRVTRLVCSTDDPEIADAARAWGAEIPCLRPAEFASDRATDYPVFAHMLAHLREHEGYRPDLVVQLRPTAPLRRAEHIDAAVELLTAHPEADCVRTVTVATQHPHKMWRFAADGVMLPFVEGLTMRDEAFNQPRQALPPAFIQNGSVDVIRATCIEGKQSLTGDVVVGLVMDELDSVNVDQEEDFLLAELLLRRRSQG